MNTIIIIMLGSFLGIFFSIAVSLSSISTSLKVMTMNQIIKINKKAIKEMFNEQTRIN